MATIKQKLTFGKLVENGGNVYRAMIAAGYSPATAQTPSKLTSSKGFQELLDEYLPDDMLLGALQTDIKTKVGNRKGELELALKIKGRLTTQETPAGNTYNTYVQQNNIDPNTPENKQLVKLMTDAMMSATKRKVIDL